MVCPRFRLPILSAVPAVGADRDQRTNFTPRQCAQFRQLGEQAVAKGGRPEMVEKRRVLVESWKRRLAAGEDPCAVYSDIGQGGDYFLVTPGTRRAAPGCIAAGMRFEWAGCGRSVSRRGGGTCRSWVSVISDIT